MSKIITEYINRLDIEVSVIDCPDSDFYTIRAKCMITGYKTRTMIKKNQRNVKSRIKLVKHEIVKNVIVMRRMKENRDYDE